MEMKISKDRLQSLRQAHKSSNVLPVLHAVHFAATNI